MTTPPHRRTGQFPWPYTSPKTYQHSLELLASLQTNHAAISAALESGSGGPATPLDGPSPIVTMQREMQMLAEHFGDTSTDRQCCRAIHIAGTKGKGSVAAYCTALLLYLRSGHESVVSDRKTGGTDAETAVAQAIGLVGTYTSPHLISPRERICVDGEPVDRLLWTRAFFEVWEAFSEHAYRKEVTTAAARGGGTDQDVLLKEIGRYTPARPQLSPPPSPVSRMSCAEFRGNGENHDGQYDQILLRHALGPLNKPFYFRFLTHLAFHIFTRCGLNIRSCVIETGIGGLLDPTNAMLLPPNPPPLRLAFPLATQVASEAAVKTRCGAGPEVGNALDENVDNNDSTGKGGIEVSCAVVTSIGIDHVELLGDTHEAIARQKAGIFKRGAAAVFLAPCPRHGRSVAVKTSPSTPLSFSHSPTQRACCNCSHGNGNIDSAIDRTKRITDVLTQAAVNAVAAPIVPVCCCCCYDCSDVNNKNNSTSDVTMTGAVQQVNRALAVHAVAAHLSKLGGAAAGRIPQMLVPKNDIGIRTSSTHTKHAKEFTMHNLPASWREALERAKLRGRGEIRRDYNGSPPPGSQPPLALEWWLDGAHTAESLTAATRWFAAGHRAATIAVEGAEGGLQRCSGPTVLVFNQQDPRRDAVALLNALVTGASRSSAPTEARGLVMWDMVVFTRNDDNNNSSGSSSSSSSNDGGAGGAGGGDLAVQETLRRGILDLARNGKINVGDVHVVDCVSAAIELCRQLARRKGAEGKYEKDAVVRVLVTGSLYLVGGLLRAIDREHGDVDV